MSNAPEPQMPKPAALASLTLEQKVDLMLAFQSIQAKTTPAGLAAITNVMQQSDALVAGLLREMIDLQREMHGQLAEIKRTLDTLRGRSLRAV